MRYHLRKKNEYTKYLSSSDTYTASTPVLRYPKRLFLAGDIMVVLNDYSDLEDKIAEMTELIYTLDWKLQDIIILPVTEIKDEWKLKDS